MRAAILTAPHARLLVDQVTLASPRQGEVRVRIMSSGICGTDLHMLDGELGLPTPTVPGHEAAGIVEELGPGVSSLSVGDHVVLLWRSSCGRCVYCNSGRPALCDLGVRVRQTGRLLDGESRLRWQGQELYHFLGVSSFAEQCIVHESAAVRIRSDIPLDRAVLAGCAVMTGVGAVMNAAHLAAGSSVVVFGTGGVGLSVIQGAALLGAGVIIAVDMVPSKLDMARAFGATHTLLASDTIINDIQSLTEGRGTDVSFEAIGRVETMQQSIAAVRKGGTAIWLGLAPLGQSVSIDPLSLVQQEKTIRPCLYGSARPQVDIPRLLDLYRVGRLNLDAMVTAIYPLSRINDAVAAVRTGTVARCLLDPTQ